ncbi:hypothetical protein GCM10010378_17760 [Streptomyces viridochromogenes]
MQEEAGAHGEEDGAGDDAGAQSFALRERTGQFVGEHRGAPGRGEPDGRRCAGNPSLDAEHAHGPPGKALTTQNRTGLERPVRFCRQMPRNDEIARGSHPIE